MRIERTFIWRDERPDEHEELRADGVDHLVRRDGSLFTLRRWDVRYRPGQRRVTEAIYDELEPA
jgi:hypothetical protein